MKQSVSPGELASRRCWARRPVGPGDVPAGKLRRAAATVSGAMSAQGGICWGSGGWRCGCCGWRHLRASTVAGVSGQSPSASRAAQALPSQPSRASPVASSRRCCGVRLWRRGLGGECRLVHRAIRSPSCHRVLGGECRLVPQSHPLPFVPSGQAVQCVGRQSLVMFFAPARWRIQDGLGQHEQLLPCRLCVVVVCERQGTVLSTF